MINKIKSYLKRNVSSLRAGMLFAIILAVAIGVALYFIVRISVVNWVNEEYNSRDAREARYDEYIDNLQTYISNNAISSEDTSKITRWVRSNKNVYVFLYKDDKMFLLGEDEKEDDKGEEKPGGDSSAPGKDDADKDSQDGIGGITVDYPTREEIFAQAAENGLRPLEFSDGTLFVSLVDFTDYIYYDVANIASLVAAFVSLTIVLMLYFHGLTEKISRLAQDVSRVYEVDMNTDIRVAKGDNEFSRLTRNVEQMRTSMLASLEKEKEALTANSELITSMSHDIRTPLTVLLGYLDIMRSHSDDPVMQEYIKASEGTALKLKDLSDDLFRYFLVFGESGDKAELCKYGAKTLFEQLFSEHLLLLQERGYKVEVHSGKMITGELMVLTDAPKLARIIDNLFSNVYKYADKSEPVSVALGVRGSLVNIVIRNRISETDTHAESNKIGLKTCKKLSELLGAGFEYGIEGFKGKKTFFARIELPTSDSERANPGHKGKKSIALSARKGM